MTSTIYGVCPHGHGDGGVIKAEDGSPKPYPNCPVCGERLTDTQEWEEPLPTPEYAENLPEYRCVECGSAPRLMVDKTSQAGKVGVGCDCTLSDGMPIVFLGAGRVNLPERWVRR